MCHFDPLSCFWPFFFDPMSFYLQGYPHRKKLREVVLVTLHFLFLYMYGSLNCKVVSFFAKSLNKPLGYYIKGTRLDLNLDSSYFKSFNLSSVWRAQNETILSCNNSHGRLWGHCNIFGMIVLAVLTVIGPNNIYE